MPSDGVNHWKWLPTQPFSVESATLAKVLVLPLVNWTKIV